MTSEEQSGPDSDGQLRCAVTGATGYIGGRLVPRLLDAGHAVRALARTPEKLDDVPWRPRVEVAKADLTDVESLVSAFDGVDVVYYLVHSMGGSKDFVTEEEKTARNVVTAAQRTGVRRIVYLSGLHPEDTELSEHLKSRTAVGDVLIESGIETVVLQAGVVIGSGSASFEMIRHLTDRLPVMTTPKWVHNKIQPIAVRDVLYYLVAAATAEVPSSRTWDIGGPDVLQYGDMMRVYAEVAGLRRRRMLVLPLLTPTIASLWVGNVTPIPGGLARPLVESLEVDAVMHNSDIDTIIKPPPDGLTAYRRAVELALHRARDGVADTTWEPLDKEPAEALPSDPDWAGEVVYTDTQTAVSDTDPDDVQKTAATVDGRWFSFPFGPGRRGRKWSIVDQEPGTRLRLQSETRAPVQAWLDISVEPRQGGGSTYHQRAIVFPRGIGGRMYWYALRPVHAAALRALARKVAGPDN